MPRYLRSRRIPSFNPRAPHGARLVEFWQILAGDVFQSTRPARGAMGLALAASLVAHVSIHAPRTGRDHVPALAPAPVPVSIHAPRTGRDLTIPTPFFLFRLFQSTRPARGATMTYSEHRRASRVSIHAPRTGRDNLVSFRTPLLCLFQSTRPARGATSRRSCDFSRRQVSIHAPRAGRDNSLPNRIWRIDRFNPRAPRGARRTQRD